MWNQKNYVREYVEYMYEIEYYIWTKRYWADMFIKKTELWLDMDYNNRFDFYKYLLD